MNVVEKYEDPPQFRFVCNHQTQSCWTPVAGSISAAVEAAQHYGCQHEGIVVRRRVVRVLGAWETVESRPRSMLREIDYDLGDEG